ncbi:MAG: phage tail tip lysozyme [Acetobacter sp.]|jgi:hypothetical protein
MATLIDALVVTLGLDPKGIKKGAAQANKSMAGVQSAAHAAGEGLANAGKEGAQAFRTLSREALAFFAVMTAGKTLKAFVQDNTATNVALANLSRNLGQSSSDIAAWQNVARSLGGTADDVTGSMQSLVSQFQTVEGRANLGRTFSQLGVPLTDANGQLRDMNKLIPDLAKSAQRLGPQIFSAYMSQRGFGQGFINMLENSPDKLMKMHAALKEYAPTDADTKASQQLQESWVKLTAQSEAFGRTIMTSVTPEVEDLIKGISGLIDKNQVPIRNGIVSYAKELNGTVKAIDWKQVGSDVKSFAEFLKSIDWQKVGSDIKEIGHDIDTVTNATVGWTRALEALFALWAASKLMRVMGAVRTAGLIPGAVTTGGVVAGVGSTIASAGINIAAGIAAAAWGDAILGIIHDRTYKGIFENRKKIFDKHDPYYSANRYGRLEQNQIRHFLYSYGVNTLKRDPRDVAAMLAQIQAESGFNTQAIGDNGQAVGLLQWHMDRQQWIEREAGKSLTSMSPQEQLEWAFKERDAKYKSIPQTPAKGETASDIAKRLTSAFVIPKDIAGQSKYRGSLAAAILGGEIGTGSEAAAAHIAATRTVTAAAMAHQPQSVTTTNAPITNNITINAPGGNPHEIRRSVEDAFRNPRLLARQANTAVQ